MTSNKKVRCKCVRCGKLKYELAAGMDLSEPFLCEPCDDKYIAWLVSTEDEDHLARFLKERPAR
jgi:hypothetical protein